MYIKNISLSNIKRFKNIYCYMVIVILIIVSLIIIYIFKYKKDIKQNDSKIFMQNQIFNINSYYTNYQATIVSNKNINSYLIDEWYRTDIGHKINFKDKMGNCCTYVITKDAVQIESYNQKNTFKMQEYISDDMNVLSILTYINIFNSLKYNKCCNIEYKNINNEKHITITNSGKNNDLCKMCELCKKNKYIYSLELILNNYNIPTRYNIKDKNKNDRISIIYNKFQFNQKIDSTIFAI